MDILTIPNNDHHTQDGTADLRVLNNRDNAVVDLLRSSRLPDADEMMPRIPNGGNGVGIGDPFLPTPEQSLRAAELLIRARKADQPRVLRLLKQGGFDVVETDVLSARRAANADNNQESSYIREFCDDILPRVQWDLLPFRFLRDLYAGWLKIHHPGAQPLSTTKIARALKPLVGEYGWQFPPLNTQNKYSGIRTAMRMDKPEPLIVMFDCKDWMGPAGSLTRPKLKTHYTGLLRQQ